MPDARTLIIDIESIPNLVWRWSLFDSSPVSPDMIVQPGRPICFAAKWHGEKGVAFHSEHHDGKKAWIKAAHAMLSEADIVVGYNSQSFDVPHLNRVFWVNKMDPPSPFRQVDLYKVIRSQFNFPSNKLGYVSTEIAIGEKVKHEGWGLWEKCIADDDAAWSRMRKYNIGDVDLTEELYDRVLPWIPNHPNVATIAGRSDACPKCGSEEGFISRGYRHNSVTRRALFQCRHCRGYVSGRTTERVATHYVA